MKESIEQRLKRIRKSKGFTQDNLAYELGITKGAYNKIEKGTTSVTIKRLKEIADILEVEIQDFFTDSNGSSKTEDSGKKYGFATKGDIEEIIKMIEVLAKEVNSLKATVSTDRKRSVKSKK